VQACAGVGTNGGQRLVDLVGNGSRQLAQSRRPGNTRQLRLRLARS
jgi:hypothetical protein